MFNFLKEKIKEKMVVRALRQGKGFSGHVAETDSARLKDILKRAAVLENDAAEEIEVKFRLLDGCMYIDPSPQVDYGYLSGEVLSITCKGHRRPVLTFLSRHGEEQYKTRIVLS